MLTCTMPVQRTRRCKKLFSWQERSFVEVLGSGSRVSGFGSRVLDSQLAKLEQQSHEVGDGVFIFSAPNSRLETRNPRLSHRHIFLTSILTAEAATDAT